MRQATFFKGWVLTISAICIGAWCAQATSAAPPGSLEFVGRNLIATANGTFHEWRVVESAIDLEAIARSHVLVEVELSSVDTGNESRDDHLRTADFFDVATHPVATVRAHSFVALGESERGGERYAVQLDIDLHGVQKTIPGEVELVSPTPMVFEGSSMLNRVDFGVGAAPSRWNPMSIGAEIPIRFRVEL